MRERERGLKQASLSICIEQNGVYIRDYIQQEQLAQAL